MKRTVVLYKEDEICGEINCPESSGFLAMQLILAISDSYRETSFYVFYLPGCFISALSPCPVRARY